MTVDLQYWTESRSTDLRRNVYYLQGLKMVLHLDLSIKGPDDKLVMIQLSLELALA